MDRITALRYSKALFDIAKEQDKIEIYNESAQILSKLLETDENFISALSNPSISKKQKMELVETALRGRIPDDFLGLFELVLRRGREESLIEIFNCFTGLYYEHKRMVKALITSAHILDKIQIDEIKNIISKKINKSIDAEFVVDPSLIAGFRVEVDGVLFDFTVSNKITKLKRQLLNNNFRADVSGSF